jgi:4-diphosphocytidyl-2-C-methyl-D-erythritol kinase
VDILKDGSLDMDDETLEGLDLVVVSVHSFLKMDRRAMTERVIEALRTRNVNTVASALTNNLESVVEPVLPVIGRMKAALLAAGALGAIMSGSGPTVFGMARSLDHARQIRTRVSRAGWACWAVRTNSGPAIRATR